MRTLIFTLFISFLAYSYSCGQSLEWAKRIGSSGFEQVNSIAVDSYGNVVTTGYFDGTVDFDPSDGVYNLTSTGNVDIFISKIDSIGNFVWAKHMGGAFSDIGYSITVDASGNVYTSGSFSGTADFDPGNGVYNLIYTGGSDIFISKLDADGNFVWAKKIGGGNSDYSYSIAVDSLENIYTTGSFKGLVDFDPGVGIFNLISAGNDDVFISKLDSSGNFVWAKCMGGAYQDLSYSVAVDLYGNVYTTGRFNDTTDFDPGAGIFNLISAGNNDIFISKLDADGNFVWAKQIGGPNQDYGHSIAVDSYGNVYTTGWFNGTVDFDAGIGVYNLISTGGYDIFISKLDTDGNFAWAKRIGGANSDYGYSIAVDNLGNVYSTGNFALAVDFDPNAGMYNLTSTGNSDIYISKIDSSGDFVWAKHVGGTSDDAGKYLAIDASGDVYTTGSFSGTVDFNPGSSTNNLTSTGGSDIFILKLNQQGISGYVFNDLNQNCQRDSFEIGIQNSFVTINPGNIIAQTNDAGIWEIDSLPIGTYSATIDTLGNWSPTCPVIQTFTVTNFNEITYVHDFGLVSTQPCASPNVSLYMPIARRCFSNQKVYVNACNQYNATYALNSAYVEVKLDSLIVPQSASLSYVSLGNNTYRFQLGNLNPGQCKNFTIDCQISCDAIQGQTLCSEANLFPVNNCVFNTLPNQYPGDFTPCTLPWDKSSLKVEGFCQNDSVYFVVNNTGNPVEGDMDCYSPVRIYIDGVYTFLDSVQLAGGDSMVLAFAGDGRTWRIEADQHPLHPGNSHPNATVEACGNVSNWTPGLVNELPQDDADPIVDIYCSVVRGSYDPNDKTGYPTGISATHDITPNQQLQYVINFQNTGTDTAFTVVVRDTMDTNLNIFSVVPGVASHTYNFKMYGPRVLEWTFYNIQLPDSNHNEAESHGFCTFTVNQNPDLPNGTEIFNSADIYFDYNAPVITNKTLHTVNEFRQSLAITDTVYVTDTVCDSFLYNGYIYDNSGTYYQTNNDTLIILNLTINDSTVANLSIISCSDYNLNGTIYDSTGTYQQILVNSVGCDSIINLDLIVLTTYNINTTLSLCQGDSIFLEGEWQKTAGVFYDSLTTINGCDSIIVTTLTINPVPSTSIYSYNPPCYSMTNGTAEIFASSGTTPYTYIWSTTQTSSYIESLGGGTYYVTVTDANGCYAVDSAVITVPDKLTVSAIITNPSTIGGSDGAIDITISGGTLPMNTIDWFSYGTNEDISNLSAGIYQLSLRDAHSCGIDTSFTLSDPPCNLQVTFDITSVSCHGLSDGAVVMHISNGFEPYSYTWADGFTDTTVINLSTNVYNVTAIDAVGCEVQTMAWVQEPDTILTSIWGSELLCNGDSNGTATIGAVFGGTTPYTYLWSSGDTTSNIELQTSNLYYVTITDSHNCQFVDSAEVTEPAAISVSSIITNTSTVGGNEGAIDITAMGGTSPYVYDWSTGFAYEDAYGLPEGTFYVTITDNNSCFHTDSFVVAGPVCDITTTVAVLSNATCWQYNNGTAEVTTGNGTSPYTYEWSDGESDVVASYLFAGLHYITITDNIGCTTVDSVEISEPDELFSNVTITDVTCFGGSDGIVTASGVGGTPPYTYYWYIDSYDSTMTGLSADYYVGEIYDVNNCWASIDAVVGQPAQIIISGNTVSSSGSDGQVDISILNGVSPFSYLWSNSDTTEDISGIAPGTYSVTVTDNNGCTNSSSFIVNNAIVCNGYDVSFSVTNVTCYGNANGEIITMVSGGTSPFSYTWSTGDTSSSLSNISGGLYSLTVTDLNNCYYSGEVSVFEPEALTTSISTTDLSCFGSNDGTADLTITGGTSPFEIIWYKGNFGPSYIYSYNEDLTSLEPQYYGVIVTDANGCSTPMTPIPGVNFIQIVQTAQIFISGNITPESSGNDGVIDITVINGFSPFTYIWSNGSTTEDLTGLVNGFYSVTVTDINGCTAQNSFILNDPACVMYSDISSITYISCYGGSNGEVTMQSFDGVSPYSYNWSNGQSTETITGLQAGNYSLTVTDANSCIFVTDIYIQQPDSMTFQFDISNVTCNGGNNGSIITNFFGGTSPYNFLWSNSETTIDISGLSAGQYTISVIDYFGCTQSDSVNVTEPSIIVNNINESICSNDSIFVGGSWQTTAGTYYDTFQSTLGCDSIIVTQLNVMSIQSSVISDAICEGQIYVFGSQLLTSAGTYYDTLTSSLGCDSIITLNLAVNSAIIVDLGADIHTCSNLGGTIILDAGNIGMTYLWNDNSTNQTISYTYAPFATDTSIFFVEVSDGLCTGTDSVEIIVEGCPYSDLLDEQLNFSIYPNPATEEVFIETSNLKLQTLALSRVEVSNFKLYSVEGKQVLEGKLNGQRTLISTIDLESGVYFIEVNVGVDKMNSKLIITK